MENNSRREHLVSIITKVAKRMQLENLTIRGVKETTYNLFSGRSNTIKNYSTKKLEDMERITYEICKLFNGSC